MRHTFVAFALLIVAMGASAGTISGISPAEISASTSELYMNITGSELGSVVRFSGHPSGDFDFEANGSYGSSVYVLIPPDITSTPGVYGVQVLGGVSGDSNVATFTVEGTIATPLTVAPGDPITAPAESREGARVFYEVTVYGGRDPNPTVTCDPPSGSLFPIGPTYVRCIARNSFGETDEGGRYVYVYDTGIPVLTLPDDIVVAADGPDGTVVTFTATATDVIDGERPVTCSPASGSRFPIGITTVECVATDLSYNEARGTFTVEVTDDDDPPPQELVIEVPDPITAEADTAGGRVVTYVVTASGTSDPDPDISCDTPSGSLFPVGVTTVLCVATDSFGNTDSGSFTVTITDTMAPVISSVSANPDVIQSPNKKMEPVSISVVVSDIADPMPSCSVFSITSNETIGPDDTRIVSDLEVEVRADRDTQERRYDIHIRCTDASGNSSEGQTTVRVPRGNSPQEVEQPSAPSRKTFRKIW